MTRCRTRKAIDPLSLLLLDQLSLISQSRSLAWRTVDTASTADTLLEMDGLLDGGMEQPPPSMPGPPVDKDSCALLGTTGLIVQALMAFLVMGTLVVKRYKENPRRPWPVWLGDVSKQVIGQGFLHFTNVTFSTLFSHVNKRDACTAYFLSIFVDCTLGVLVIYSMVRIFSYILIERMRLKGYRTGQYYEKKSPTLDRTLSNEGDLEAADMHASHSAQSGSSALDDDGQKVPSTTSPEQDNGDPLSQRSAFQFSWWGKQLLVYLASLCVMKAAILGFFWIPAIFTIGDWLLSWLGQESKVIFVLMIFPLAMNALQFLLIDAILKSKAPVLEADSAAQPRPSPPRHSSGDGHGHDDESRAFLFDHTHDDIEAGGSPRDSLPAYQAGASSSSQPSSRLQSSQLRSQAPGETANNTLLSNATDRALPFAASSSSSPSPFAPEKQGNTIPLQVVAQSRVNVSLAKAVSADTGESESNGWDWLSDDGLQDDQFEDDRPKDMPPPAAALGKTTKVA